MIAHRHLHSLIRLAGRTAACLALACPFVHAADSPKLKIAVVQMAFAPTLDGNRDRIVAGIGDAAARGARVAVFPEGALNARAGDPPAAVAAALAQVRGAAKRHGVYVVLGGVNHSAALKKMVNWMRVFGPDGAEVFHYDKLFNNPRAPMPGVFRIDGVPCSGMICADRWLRGVEEIPIQQGARVTFELSNNFACEWVESFGWYWNVPRALRNNVWVIMANTVDSTIWDDLTGMLESRHIVRGTPKPEYGPVEVDSPFSANLVASTTAERPLIVATRRVATVNPHFQRRPASLNPQMEPWYRIGAALIAPSERPGTRD
ncbi:MAG: nitrilase-related carbon-nitrogen hydrolase [Opitutaceae bacterium]|nr:nitrilase-related carbon-nitrogen hydrolase [Opitutaceae bacterium]